MRGFKNFKGSNARCPSIHFLFYVIELATLLNATTINAVHNPTSDIENPSILQTHLTAFTKLVESEAQSRLPLLKHEVFNGDSLKFPIWLKAFETLIKTHPVNSTETLHFLGRYVAGEAKSLRDTC